MTKRLRSRLSAFLIGRKEPFENLLRMSYSDFIDWIEFQFQDNINWDNRSTFWEIDHVIPVSYFNLENEDDIKVCCHWSNLRPLEILKNRKKSNTLCFEDIENQYNKSLDFIKSKNIQNTQHLNIHNWLTKNMLKSRV